MALIRCENLSLGYDGRVITENISFSVNEGDYLCIIGENGAGKSTLMKTVLGLKKPLGGTVEFGGGMKKNEIGYLPQQTPVQKDFPATVREVVLSGCLNHCGLRPFFSSKDKRLAEKHMERLGITQLASRCYRELSGGQQQRVLLARALCATGKLILLDEPVAGLDPKVTTEMYELISELNSKDGITVIMVSHDMNAAMKYASHILHISHSGSFFGTKQEYLSSDKSASFISGKEAAADAL